MKKEKYDRAELEIIEFKEDDVISTDFVISNTDPYELPFIPNKY